MADLEKDGQMTFDFDDFSEPDRSPRKNPPGKKFRDDMTPGLFDSAVSEEEEMKEFLREIHQTNEAPAEEPAQVLPESDFPFDLPAEPSKESISAQPEQTPSQSRPDLEEDRSLPRRELKRAALAFLASLNPSGLAADVPVWKERGKAGAAAFWLESGKVVRTAAVEIRTALNASVETAGNAEQFNMLKLARMEREMLEQEIRRTEPELRDESMLFSEFEHWDYAASGNSAYQECVRKIRQLEHNIFHGSRLERFRSAGIASELYLVVPEGSLDPAFLADGWGLVYVKKDLTFELIKAPVRQDVPEKNQLYLALGVAASGKSEVLFAHGIHCGSGDLPKCGPLPRRRRCLKN